MSSVPTASGGFTALGFDPAPGKLATIDDLADKYQTVGRDLAEAKTSIDQIIKKQGVWEGQASDAFARRVGDLPDYLDKASRSMTQAADAIGRWSTELAEMQRQARELEARAKKAAEVAQDAKQNPDFALANQTFTDQQSLQIAQKLLDNAEQQLQQAIGECAEIQEAAKRLLEQHTHLAEEIAGLLDKARELAPEEPGILGEALDALGGALSGLGNAVLDLGDTIWNVVQDNAELLSKLSDVVGDIGNVIGIVGDWLPEPAGAIVGAVATGFGLAALGGHVTAKAAGADVAPETLSFDAMGAATSLVGIFLPEGTDTPLKVTGYGLLGAQLGGEVGKTASGQEFEGPIGDIKNYWIPKGAGALFLASPVAGAGVAFWNAMEQGAAADNAPERKRDRQEDKVWE